MTKCCFCIPLRSGVIITALLMIIGGAFLTIKISLDIAFGRDIFKYAKGSTISLAALYGLITIGSMLGFFVITCINSSKMLMDYSKLEFGFIGLCVFFHIKVVVEIILCKSIILDECSRSLKNDNYPYSTQVDYLLGTCNKLYNDGLIIIGSLCVITIFFLVFFALVITSYANQRKNDEYITGPTGHNRVSPITPAMNMANRLNNGANVPPVVNVPNAPNVNGLNTQTTNGPNMSNVNGSNTQTTINVPNVRNVNGSNIQTTNGPNVPNVNMSNTQTTNGPDAPNVNMSNTQTTNSPNVPNVNGSNTIQV